jgi:signal transduction histidine kinase
MKRRFFPDSILAWLLLILVAGVIASQAVTMLLHNLNRNEVLLRLEDQRAAERIAALAVFLDHTAPVLRRGVAEAMSGPSLDARVSTQPLVAGASAPRELDPLAAALADRLQGTSWQEIRVGGAEPSARERTADLVPIRISIGLRDGAWLNFQFPMVASLPWASPQLLGLTLGSVVAVLGLCLYAILRLMRPLDRLTRAAESLGRAGSPEPLPETGVGEVRRAAAAFNRMQARIGRLVEDRLQMIAAISHDLKTPITRLRLRAELMDDAETRGKLLKDLDEMEAMIGSTLAFAREEGNPEPVRTIDLRALIKEAGEHQPQMRLSIAGAGPWEIAVQPLALKRAIANLIDNAVKYGGEALVNLSRGKTVQGNSNRGQACFEIRIDDRGPGIPSAETERVFRPFYRLEASRNRESGGTGLGLAIARSAILAQGGEIRLLNRTKPDGEIAGLTVIVTLPV